MQKMNKTGFNIRKQREIRGFSQEYMADALNISQASYARLENENTKVTVERLYKIAEILESSIIDFFEVDKVTIQNQTNNEGAYANGYIQNQTNNEGAYANGYVQNLHIENKEVYEKLLKSKDDQIELLTQTIEKLLK